MNALYFAYGSNLLRERLLVRCPGLTYAGRATLPAHLLAFDKVSTDGSGKCAFAPAAGDKVQGVLWNVPEIELGRLDLSEGRGYERDIVKVVCAEQQEYDAITYRASHRSNGLRPYDWYLALVLAGAEQQGLPQPYIDSLRATPFHSDPDTSRPTRREALAAIEAAGMVEVFHHLTRRIGR
jgi:hypothetical protein